MISPIQQLSAIGGSAVSGAGKAPQEQEQGMFAQVFQSAIDNVKTTEANVVETQQLLATGQLDNPALLTIAETKSAIAVDLMVQLRNKAMEAYSELTRINL